MVISQHKNFGITKESYCPNQKLEYAEEKKPNEASLQKTTCRHLHYANALSYILMVIYILMVMPFFNLQKEYGNLGPKILTGQTIISRN